tara:strand:- start:828 stop:1022 length:195 start_codon:yes stop_codon:yes gene_type:complete
MNDFQILLDGELKTYTEYDEIPKSFDNVISFRPYLPPPPHTEEQHTEIHGWEEKFKQLLQREMK